MRIVLDTNVLVSGFLNPFGPPGRILDLAVAGEVSLLFDDRILAEYQDVLARPQFSFWAQDVRAVLAALEAGGESVAAAPMKLKLPDLDDLPFLEVAASGLASALVTGNTRHFKPVQGSYDVCVLHPAAFLERIQA